MFTRVYRFIDSVSFLRQAKRYKARSARRGPLVVDVDSGELASIFSLFLA